MAPEQNESEDSRPSTATKLVHDRDRDTSSPRYPESDVLIVDWDGPNDPDNPKK